VYRWPYDYSVPGVDQDFIAQNVETVEADLEAAGIQPDATKT
jgi:hypothetical protein